MECTLVANDLVFMRLMQNTRLLIPLQLHRCLIPSDIPYIPSDYCTAAIPPSPYPIRTRHGGIRSRNQDDSTASRTPLLRDEGTVSEGGAAACLEVGFVVDGHEGLAARPCRQSPREVRGHQEGPPFPWEPHLAAGNRQHRHGEASLHPQPRERGSSGKQQGNRLCRFLV